MDPNATLKVSPERLAELASVDPDVTPGPSAALRQIGSVRPPPVSNREGTRPSATSHSGAYLPPSQRPRTSQRPPKPSAFGTVMLYIFIAILVSAAVIGLIALAGRFLR